MIYFKDNPPIVEDRIKYLTEHPVDPKGVIPIEFIWDVATDNQVWFRIPGFNGYEISDYKNIRSMKFFKSHKFGTLVKYSINKDGEKVYELSDNDNMRIKITEKEIIQNTFMNNPNLYEWGYPIRTYQCNNFSRNKRMILDQSESNINSKKGLVRKSVPVNKKEATVTSKGRFTISNNPKPLI